MTKTKLGEELVEAIVEAHRKGGKVLIAGNGGLCAIGEHFSAELMGKFAFEVFIPCIALTGNTSLLTALANDLGFEEVFAHQVRVLGRPGDVLIAMTTSASLNIVKAIMAGNELGLTTALLCGQGSPDMAANQTYRMNCEDAVAAVQQEIMSFLHYVAHNCKRSLTRG